MSQILNVKDTFSDLESIVGSKTGSEASSKATFNKKVNQFLRVLVIKIDQDQKQKKKKLQVSQIDIFKRTKLFNKIFDYIYVARY